MVITRNAEKLEEARRETIEQAEELQALIRYEIRQLKQAIRREQVRPGAAGDKTADLARLASALKDVSAARIAVLCGTAALRQLRPAAITNYGAIKSAI